MRYLFKTVSMVMAGLMALPSFALDVESFTLENGMDVYVFEDHRTPMALNMVWYPIGAADEVSGQTGIAHMLEHLMFKGTDTIPPQEFSKIVARHGGQDNAFTSYDYTAYYQKVGVDNLQKMMEIEADRMRGLTFTDKEFLPERDVVAEERRMRVDSNPMSRFYEKLAGVHMEDHPYGRPVIGWMRDIQAYTSTIAHQWYLDYYQPSNAFLIVAGDVSAEEVKPLIEKTYGQIPNTKTVERPQWPVEPLFEKAKVLKHVDETIRVPSFVRMYRTPSYFAGIAGADVVQEDILPLSVLAFALGNGSTSKLYTKLVKEQKIATAASAGYYAGSKGESSFDFYITPADGVKLSEIESAMEKIITDFIAQKDLTEEELTRAKTQFLAADVYARDDIFVTAYRLGKWIVSGGSAETFDDWMKQIEQVQVEDVIRVAEKYLQEPQSTTGYAAASEALF